jgi:hypothetical protein
MYNDDYNNKVQQFIDNNNFTVMDKDPTKQFQKTVWNIVNESPVSINKHQKAKYINLNPTIPSIRGLPKVHKENCPIRPIINWQNAPAFKIAKLLNKLIPANTPLPNIFNVKNSIQLTKDLTEITFSSSLKLASFDIENMYSNIPTNNLINIIKYMRIEQQIQTSISNEIINLTRTIIEQNYFMFQDQCYVKHRGLAMGAPSSALLSEIFLQHLEITEVYNILMQYRILGYFWYVDDILIVFNSDITDIHAVNRAFNTLAPSLKFTMELESNHKINFLDITIAKESNKLSFSVYRKPTATDTIIPARSCHTP